MSLLQDLKHKADQAGGSGGTKSARGVVARDYVRWTKEHNIQTRRVDEIKQRHIIAYGHDLATKVTQGEITGRTAQNRMSAIRKMLIASGNERLANRPEISNKAIGLSGFSRDGKRRAITSDEYSAIHDAVRKKDQAIAATMEIQRALGLRQQEAIKGGTDETLARWERELQKGDNVRVIEGTKGHRPRASYIPDRDRAIKAIKNARAIIAENKTKFLVNGRGKSLKSALNRYNKVLANHGMKDEISPHAMRYSYAHDSVNAARSELKMSEREAFIFTSQNLGHGDGRGRYIKRVYGKEI